MTLMLFAFFILVVSISESVSHPSFQICPNCKLAGRQVQQYRGMRERFLETSFKNEKDLETISAKKEIAEKEVPTRSFMANMWHEMWPNQNVSPDRWRQFFYHIHIIGGWFVGLAKKLNHWISKIYLFYVSSTTELNIHSELPTGLMERSISQGLENDAGKLKITKRSWRPCSGRRMS